MDGKEEGRIFVGGLSWQTDERKLQEAFDRFGKVVDAQIMLERHTNRHRGFGFVTFEDRFGDRYVDDRYDGGRYGYRDQVDTRDRYAGGRDRYANDRYPSGGDHFGADRYGGGPDRYAPSGYGRERERSYERDGVRGGGGGGGYDRSGPRGGGSYDRDGPRGGMGGGYDRDGPRGGVADRYGGGGPARYNGGSYRERPGPYDRPSRGGGRFDDRY
ncbi:hypothetical protein PVAP13_9KG049628 [Panicum virgatum]|uniref:RRM domain-containing protein n=1 Tax=Panicum virgatum TaxID=38727 RepID=A0A8T0NDC1_PANVG|nr:hypothetical protein PVAP13_9KG049628 [Panicum virgatum]